MLKTLLSVTVRFKLDIPDTDTVANNAVDGLTYMGEPEKDQSTRTHSVCLVPGNFFHKDGLFILPAVKSMARLTYPANPK